MTQYIYIVVHIPSGKRVRWNVQEQVIPISQDAQILFENKNYKQIVDSHTTHGIFTINQNQASNENESMIDLEIIDTRQTSNATFNSNNNKTNANTSTPAA